MTAAGESGGASVCISGHADEPVDAAIAHRGATAKLLLLAAAMFMVGTNASIIAGLLPRIASSLGSTESTVSYSITLYSVIVAIAAPVASITLARTSRAALMAGGAALFSIGTIVTSLSSDPAGFFGGRAVAALGGAALVPTASAVATSLVPHERRGRALALVAMGFTLSGALGTPFGTALGSAATWRLPMWVLAGVGIIVGVSIVVGLRRAPTPDAVPFRQRLAPLADRQIVATVLTTLFVVVSGNVVFIFSATLTAGATGGSGTLLAVLLMIYGCSGLVGNQFVGRLTDRYGSKHIAVTALGAAIALLAALPFVVASYPLTAVVFGVWGFMAAGMSVPVQHQLVELDPQNVTVTMSWNSTAMYVGIALSPPVGNLAIGLGGPHVTPFPAALCVALGLGAFLIGRVPTRARRLIEGDRARVGTAPS
ncbi:MFS transporter [Gryllotalpicola daejeonensis]|uniref:MFS transporter n=1 Tax=Gryllotalpicola daejeonensis TaxID=993087 RepID=A0ABP7ZNS0_9MICO